MTSEPRETPAEPSDSNERPPKLSSQERSAWIADLLKRRTGDHVATWNERIRSGDFQDEPSLRAWLTEQGVGCGVPTPRAAEKDARRDA